MRRSAAQKAPTASGASLPNERGPVEEPETETSLTVAAGQLRAFIERVERLMEENKTIRDDIKEVFAEAKGTGFDTKAMRTLIRLRAQDEAERAEAETILNLYKSALGMA